MPKETTMKGRLGDLQRFMSLLTVNRAELEHLEGTRQRFEAQLAAAQEAADRQAVHTAAKQEASKQLRTHVSEGQRLANILRLAVKQYYGIRAEKVAEFGMQPFRGRPRKPAPAPEATAPPAPTSNPIN